MRTDSFRFLDYRSHGAQSPLHSLLVLLGQSVKLSAVIFVPAGVNVGVLVIILYVDYHLRLPALSLRRRICARQPARQSETADSAPGVAVWEVTLSARKVVPCVRWPATRITAHIL